MGDEEESSKRVCAACGLSVSPGENACPRCGNVFRKDLGEWEWKLISRERSLKKAVPKTEIDAETDDD